MAQYEKLRLGLLNVKRKLSGKLCSMPLEDHTEYKMDRYIFMERDSVGKDWKKTLL